MQTGQTAQAATAEDGPVSSEPSQDVGGGGGMNCWCSLSGKCCCDQPGYGVVCVTCTRCQGGGVLGVE